MNSKIVNFAVKSVSAVATAVVLLVSNPVNSYANSIDDKKNNQSIENQVSVIYAGSNSKAVVFHLTFENPKAEKFSLVIKNDVGDVVYEAEYSDVHFDKNIFLDAQETQVRPTFIIRTATQEVERSMSVNKKSGEAATVAKK
jgi:hypothetical protein